MKCHYVFFYLKILVKIILSTTSQKTSLLVSAIMNIYRLASELLKARGAEAGVRNVAIKWDVFSIDKLVTKAVMHNKRCYLKLFLQVGHLFLHFSILLLQSFGLCTTVWGLSKEHLRETAADYTLISVEKLFMSFWCLLMLSTAAFATKQTLSRVR